MSQNHPNRSAWARAVLDRVDHILNRVIMPATHVTSAPVNVEVFHVTGEPIPAEEAFNAVYSAFHVGDLWGPRWGTAWFRIMGTVPREWIVGEPHLRLDLGGAAGADGFSAEGLVWVDGKPWCGVSSSRPDVPLLGAIQPGSDFTLYVEAAANPKFPLGVAAPLHDPDPTGRPTFVLRRAELALLDPLIAETVAAITCLKTAAGALTDQDVFGLHLLTVLERFTQRIGAAGTRKAILQAHNLALSDLKDCSGDTLRTYIAIGHSHLDIAWLWPMREGKRKAARTFSNMLRLMETTSDFYYAASQLLVLEWMKQDYPTLYDEIKALIKQGRIELVGSMWVEPNCDLIGPESLVRQIVMAQRFAQREFGRSMKELWMPDCYGFPAALPQIMRQADIDLFVTGAPRDNGLVEFPYGTFKWEGLDGSRVVVHRPPSVPKGRGKMSAREVYDYLGSNTESDVGLYVFGLGDGGGGPTRLMTDAMRYISKVTRHVDIIPGTVSSFRSRLHPQVDDLPVWVGAAGGDLHPGLYTSQARIKELNRTIENLLSTAEMVAALYAGHDESLQLQEMAARIWPVALTNQFHDIIGGVSINRVHREAVATLERARSDLETGIASALESILSAYAEQGPCLSLVALNPIAQDWYGVVTVPEYTGSSSVAQGERPPLQSSCRNPTVDYALIRVPSCGLAVRAASDVPEYGAVTVDPRTSTLSNDMIALHWTASGHVDSMIDMLTGQELLSTGSMANQLELYDDYPKSHEAWDIDLHGLSTVRPFANVADSIDIVEYGPLIGGLQFVWRNGQSTVCQVITLEACSTRITVDCDIDWNCERQMLKTSFGVKIRSNFASYGSQFGYIQVPTHRNTVWEQATQEVATHSWVDLSDGLRGIAVLTGAKFGVQVSGSRISLSLLRGPRDPDPKSDIGGHSFSYAIYPHAGTLQVGDVIGTARAFENPPIAQYKGVCAEDSCDLQPIQCSTSGVVIQTVKPADIGRGIVFRAYETWGTHQTVHFDFADDVVESAVVDILERIRGTLAPAGARRITLSLAPFEIVTIKVQLRCRT